MIKFYFIEVKFVIEKKKYLLYICYNYIVRNDVASNAHMNRLLQGDVGSGKTIVALLAMLLAIGVNSTRLMATKEYSDVSTRGNAALTINSDGTKKFLWRSYWPYMARVRTLVSIAASPTSQCTKYLVHRA